MKKEIIDELQEMNSFLAEHKIEDGYQAPANYFNNLQLDLLQKLDIKNENNAQEKPLGTFQKIMQAILRPAPLLTAAALALFALGIFFWPAYDATIDAQLSFSDLSEEEVHAYIEDNIDEFDLDLLSIADASIDETTLMNKLEDDQLDEYINNNIEEFDEQLFDEIF